MLKVIINAVRCSLRMGEASEEEIFVVKQGTEIRLHKHMNAQT